MTSLWKRKTWKWKCFWTFPKRSHMLEKFSSNFEPTWFCNLHFPPGKCQQFVWMYLLNILSCYSARESIPWIYSDFWRERKGKFDPKEKEYMKRYWLVLNTNQYLFRRKKISFLRFLSKPVFISATTRRACSCWSSMHPCMTRSVTVTDELIMVNVWNYTQNTILQAAISKTFRCCSLW